MHPYLVLNSPVAFDSLSVAAGAVSAIAPPPTAEVKIRTEFPETWIWDMFDDNGCDIVDYTLS